MHIQHNNYGTEKIHCGIASEMGVAHTHTQSKKRCVVHMVIMIVVEI